MSLNNRENAPEADSSNEIYTILSNQRRRYVLYILAQQDEPVGIGTLAERVASIEHDMPVEDVTYEQRKSVYTGLHQNHLPLMEQSHFIRSGRGWDRIELTARAAEIGNYLFGTVETGVSWNVLYVGLAAVGLGLVSGIWLRPSPLPVLPDIAYIGIVMAAFAVLAIVHAYSEWTGTADPLVPDSGSFDEPTDSSQDRI